MSTITSLENREKQPLTHRISEALKAFLVKFQRMGPAERAEGHITKPIQITQVTPGRGAIPSYKISDEELKRELSARTRKAHIEPSSEGDKK